MKVFKSLVQRVLIVIVLFFCCATTQLFAGFDCQKVCGAGNGCCMDCCPNECCLSLPDFKNDIMNCSEQGSKLGTVMKIFGKRTSGTFKIAQVSYFSRFKSFSTVPLAEEFAPVYDIFQLPTEVSMGTGFFVGGGPFSSTIRFENTLPSPDGTGIDGLLRVTVSGEQLHNGKVHCAFPYKM